MPSRRTSRVGALTCAVALASTALATSIHAGAAAPAWAATATKALSLTHATDLGAAPATTPLRITVGLTGDRAGVDALVKAQNTRGSSVYGQYLTAAQFTSRFAATAATAQAVSSYLSTAGLTNVTVAANRLQITADATVATADSAFNTQIEQFSQAGKTVIANTKPAQVPTSLAGKVSAVLGLSSLGASTNVSVPKLTGYYPDEYPTVYDATTTAHTGEKTTLAIIAEGDLTGVVADLRTAEKARNLPQVPVSLVPAGIASPDVSGADEWDLDTQTSTAQVPKATRLYIYVATSLTDSDLARAINLFVTQNVAKQGSASLGLCDTLAFADGSTTIDDMALGEAALQGQTFFASTGDTGLSCAVAPTNGVPGSGPVDTEYPASSPYTLGIGGTTLDTDDNDVYQTEIAWNSGGGGPSAIENAPYWQNGAVPTYAAGTRGLPDVALDADPNTGANIVVNGTTEEIGGTSLASPLALGLWTRMQSDHCNMLGFASPKLYALYTAAQVGATTPAATPGFHDIIAGSNGYPALPGWDFTTGLGSFDVSVLDKALPANTCGVSGIPSS